ncbi:MAG: carbonic anhydrase [Pseudomonadota bacterium]
MESISILLDGYRNFKAGASSQQSELYATLGTGQSPDVMVIGCADSRVEPAEIFNTQPGQIFVVRNVANLVHPSGSSDIAHSVASAVEFAVTALKVKHIVVLGHAGCGGVNACLSAGNDKPIGEFIAPWVQALDATRDRVLADNPEDPQTTLEHAGVATSIANLMTYSFVKDAIASGDLELHGAWFKIGDRELYWQDKSDGTFRPV